MTNSLLIILEVFIFFSLVVIIDKKIGYVGLIAWCAVAPVIANIQVVKLINIFGIEVTLGNVMFASTFLANDIMTEKYGEDKAKKSVVISLCSVLVYLLSTQFMLAFSPSSNDIMHEFMMNVFSVSPRICFASTSMFFLSNMVDVKIFSIIKEKMHGKKMWIRNNASTILCNCLENFAFSIIAFSGIYGWEIIWNIAISTSLVEIAIALSDTPFLYAAVKEGRK